MSRRVMASARESSGKEKQNASGIDPGSGSQAQDHAHGVEVVIS